MVDVAEKESQIERKINWEKEGKKDRQLFRLQQRRCDVIVTSANGASDHIY